MQTFSYDIVIVGGGMVGMTLACALAQSTPFSMALIEAQPSVSPWDSAQYYHRVSAIAHSSQRIFEAIGIWKTIASKRVSAFSKMAVFDGMERDSHFCGNNKGEIFGNNRKSIFFDGQEIGETELGWIVENNLIQEALREKLKTYPQVHWMAPIKLVGMVEKETGIKLIAHDEKIIKAQLAVAADGAKSWLRESSGILVDQADYQQSAIVATIATQKAHEQIARQIFLKTGPLAFLPLAEAQAISIVWSLPTMIANQWMAMDDTLFKQKLYEAFPDLGEVTSLSERSIFPLVKQQAKQYVKSHIALVGDAAHTVHPLAGQGVNMGLLDAASLVDVITEAYHHRRSVGSLHTLRRYERWRRADNLQLMAGIDGIWRLFASEAKTLKQVRSLGVTMVERSSRLKNFFMRQATGHRGGLPQLAT